MRTGRNPTKQVTNRAGVEVVVPPPVSVGLLTHVPFLAGYHAEQLDVIRLAVVSARQRAGRPIHLLVVDNGSCEPVVEWLMSALDEGIVDQLVLNRRNLGKVTALSQILLGAPGPDVVYADGDLLFLPGWLDAMLQVRDAFPEAGVIGGSPMLLGNTVVDGVAAPVALPDLPDDVVVERGRFVADSDVRRSLEDTGWKGDDLERRVAEITAVDDVRLRRGDATALLESSHCQFLLTGPARAALEPRVGTQALSSEEDVAFDDALRRLGFLRVSVPSSGYRHLGNRLTADDRAALAELSAAPVTKGRRQLTSSVWGLMPVRRMARRLHHWTFEILYESDPGARSRGR